MYNVLFTPKKIGILELENRFVMPAMDSHLTTVEHEFNEQAMNYYGERARGGFGLLITEYLCVSEEGLSHTTQAGIYHDRFIPSLHRLADRVHQEGGKIFAQIQHCGRRQGRSCTDLPAVSCSSIPFPGGTAPVHELTTRETEVIVKKFVDAAVRAKKAGFDGVEIHAAHGYLLDQFLSKAVNKRSDKYGGSVANRARIVCEIVEGIKSTLGDFPVSVRINAEEQVEGGNRIEDTVAGCLCFQMAGADVLNVSCSPAIRPYQFRPGFNLEATKRIRDAVSIPVIGIGRINDPTLALSAVVGGAADFVALGRQSVCDPHFPQKVKTDRQNEIFTCTGCMQRCLYSESFEEGYGISCMINPFSGKEGQWEIKPVEQSKRIGIVGAGPAGLEAAWILAKRGHVVDLYEKEEQLGGQYRYAAVPPWKEALAKTIGTYTTLCEKYGVTIHTGTEVNAELLKAAQYDELVISTGSVPLCPKIPGIDSERVCFPIDILSYQIDFAGKNILVLGAGLVGLETAEIMLARDSCVTIVDMLSTPVPLAPLAPRDRLLKQLESQGVCFVMDSKVTEIFLDGICYQRDGMLHELHGFDLIVLSFGIRPNTQLSSQLDTSVANIHLIGDAQTAGDAKKAIFEAAQLAIKL